MAEKQSPTPNRIENPLTGKALILDSKRYAIEFRSKSWFYTISTMMMLVLAFVVTYQVPYWPIKIVLSHVTALLIVRLFVIYHDYQHGAILQNSKPAMWLMKLFGIFVLAPNNIWRRTHNHHHNNNSKLSNSGVGSYPLLSKEKFQELSKQQKSIYLISRHPLTIFFGYITLFIFDFNVKSLMRSPKNHLDSLLALVLHVAIGAVIFYYGGLIQLLLTWMLPFAVAQGFGAYLFYAQHNFPGAIFKENKDWEYTSAALYSTSYLVMNPVLKWFTGNIGYHHVHHVNHKIPFYRLKEAMQNMPELQNPIQTTLNPRDIVACLKLKVWDPQKGEMTSI